jgi:predicted esterase
MLKFINRFTLLIGVLLFYRIAGANEIQNNNSLLKPTGYYGIGYQDVFLINTDICPDAFYKKHANENDFSPNNDLFCHEIALRIYYPTHNILGLGAEYYKPYINDTNKWLASTYNLNQKQIKKLHSAQQIKTYTHKDSKPVSNEIFPVVIFMPGAWVQAQAYTNIISNLVSNGYIVVGVNSLFINGALELENGHIVLPPAVYLDTDGRRENISDLKFILNHLKDLTLKHELDKHIDWQRVGLLGHSRGAMSIVNFLTNLPQPPNVKALILMDPADKLGGANYPLPGLSIKTMIIWSSQFKHANNGSSTPTKYNLVVTLKPKGAKDEYSGHNNFMDASTIQYHSAYQIPALQKLPKMETFALGVGNGYEISKAINDYILVFTDSHLKKHLRPSALTCKSFTYHYLCER